VTPNAITTTIAREPAALCGTLWLDLSLFQGGALAKRVYLLQSLKAWHAARCKCV